jgi:hypothetical protein
MIANNIIYPKELDAIVRFNTKYIPREIKQKEELIPYHKYWIKDMEGIYKLTKIEEYFKVNYYYLENKSSSQLFTYPLEEGRFFELVNNTDDLLEKDIIDNETVYEGYKIKYWFYKNWNKQFEDYLKYIAYTSMYAIKDNSNYIVQGVYLKNKYRNCKIIIP